MAVVYYPTSASVYTRQVVGSELIEQVITTTPDLIFVLTGSTMFTSSMLRGGRSVVLCSAYTPTAIGADPAEVSVPYSVTDGVTPLSWSIKRLALRTQTPETTTSSLDFEKSMGTGSFSASYIGSLTLLSQSYESYTASTATCLSGDKLRFNVTTLGGATNWTAIVEIST